MNDGQHVIDLEAGVSTEEVLRLLGYREGMVLRAEVERTIEQLLAKAHEVMRPRAVYTIRDVERMTDTQLQLRGCPPIHAKMAAFFKPALRVAVCVSTIGPELEALASEQMAGGEMLAGFVLDAIGSAAADAASDALADHIMWNETAQHEGITPPFAPGYCGLPTEEQRTLFAVVDAARIGVTLTPAMMMRPIKSVSGLVGIGDQSAIEERGVPCQWCELDSCRMRRKTEPARRRE